jgi:very-short-patch-repair endonuclease
VSRELQQIAREMRREPTAAEEHLWLHLRERQVAGLRFRRQYAIERFVLDFFCASARLAVEVDGEIHQEQADRDAARSAVLEQHRIRVLRFTNAEVLNDIPTVIERIAATTSQQPERTRT